MSGGAASGIDAVDVILRDGSTLRLRAPEEADREPLVEFFEGFPAACICGSMVSPPVDDRLVEPVLESDWIERGALLASTAETGGDRIVALANYVRLRDPTSAEIAFTVADAYQGRGIATRLLEQLAALAAARGIERFVGEVMADNAPMIGVFEGVGFEVSRTPAGGEVEMTFPSRQRPTTPHTSRHATTPQSSHRWGRSSSALGRRRRGVASPGHHRRRTLPQHSRGRVRRSRLPGEPKR